MLSQDVICLLEGVRILLSFITCLPSFTLILWFPPCPRCVGVLQTVVQRVGVFLLLIFILIILALVAVGSCAQHFDFLALLMLQPYCSVHYGLLPPIWPEHLKPFVNMKFTRKKYGPESRPADVLFKNLCINIYYCYLYKMSLYQNVAALFGIGHILDNISYGYRMKKFNNKKTKETNVSFFLHWIKSFRLVFLYQKKCRPSLWLYGSMTIWFLYQRNTTVYSLLLKLWPPHIYKDRPVELKVTLICIDHSRPQFLYYIKPWQLWGQPFMFTRSSVSQCHCSMISAACPTSYF